MTYSSNQAVEVAILTLVVGREARGAGFNAMLGVAWSISNRVQIVLKKPGFWDWGRDWLSVISTKGEYSSIVPPQGEFDPNLIVYPDLSLGAWRDALDAAELAYWGDGQDPTGGAVSYFSPPADPEWAKSPLYQRAIDIPPFHFFKLATA